MPLQFRIKLEKWNRRQRNLLAVSPALLSGARRLLEKEECDRV